MDNDNHALSYNAMRDANHDATMRVCQKTSAGTRKNYTDAYQRLLGSVARYDPSALRLDFSGLVTAEAVDRAIEEAPELSARSKATLLRNLIGFCLAAYDEPDLDSIRKRAQGFEAMAKIEGRLGPRGYAIKESELPEHLRPNFAQIRGGPYEGEFLRYLGAQSRAGFDLKSLTAEQLGCEQHIAAFEAQSASGISATRMNGLACALQAAGIDPKTPFGRAAAIRRQNSANPGGYDRRSLPFEELPYEVQKRFEFVTNYKNGAASVEIHGEKISLPKAQTRDRRDYSPTQVGFMKLALRMHYTILKNHDEAFAQDLTNWTTPKAFRLHEIFYAGASYVTQSSRLEELIAALGAILGDCERKLFPIQRRQIRLLNAVAAKVAQPVVVPNLPTRVVRCRSLAIAKKALKRWRDLVTTENPYRDPVRLAGLIRTALIVAILSELPLRLRTMSLLTADFIKRNGLIYDISIPGRLMKNGKPYYQNFSAGLSRMIDIWLNEVRPFLAGPNDAVSLGFFVSNLGNTASRIVFQRNVPEFMEAFFKERISMHAFRKLHASELTEDSEEARFRLQQIWGESQKPYRGAKQAREVDRTSSLLAQSEGIFV